MARPDTVPPRVWKRLTPDERIFIVKHGRMHAEMRRILGVSLAEYNKIADDLINEELAREGVKL